MRLCSNPHAGTPSHVDRGSFSDCDCRAIRYGDDPAYSHRHFPTDRDSHRDGSSNQDSHGSADCRGD